MYFLYNILLLIVAIILFPYYLIVVLFKGKYRKSIIPKLGGRQAEIFARLKSKKRLWIHAVSVGEVTAAAPIVEALKNKVPDADIVFSTSTETGQQMARSLIKGASAFIYFPLDFPCVVSNVLKTAAPDVFVMVETEIWPNFLKACQAQGVKTLMVNGRISPRSYGKYRLTAFFWKRIFAGLTAVAMITEVDARRMKKIGMPADKVTVMGNAKYDGLAARISDQLRDETCRRLNARKDERFFVAGSTHPKEEEIIIRVYRRILDLYPYYNLIIVPRHIERSSAVIDLLGQNGFTDVITLSKINRGKMRSGERIIVVDVIGELFKIYCVATVVYCGGSLVPKGGQNILEAAAWGKFIFYGPSMEDFSEEKKLLEEAGCAMTVKNARDLQKKILQVLRDEAGLEQRGAPGKAVVAANKGAAGRYAEMIEKFLG
ncbi:MAG TPA: hypothetical protein ENN23_09865 [Deltaproteobacteria bacterium]|nr:hypothetical protein [Deltaproteobacteria bacterium]